MFLFFANPCGIGFELKALKASAKDSFFSSTYHDELELCLKEHPQKTFLTFAKYIFKSLTFYCASHIEKICS
jgi:hypothetical protein